MARYFIDTTDGVTSRDDVGYELPTEAALLRLVRRTLADMLRTEPERPGRLMLRADVRDVTGAQRLSAVLTLDLTIKKPPSG